ncbi:hypothetical protein [Mucilaginibacter sp. MD40]|uniref:hypothetical protein n=1 Tax=Mucilaginibacter sp. MD40 TaxID=2029590 RepID=UPI00118087DD|nr:hypothetical protein [Mucilaginibacter sp. MD40]
METNDYLNADLKPLVEKVYQEGVKKAKDEAEQIIEAAKRQAEELLKKAEQQIARLEERSLAETNRVSQNLKSELKAVAGQTISAVKTELAAVITKKTSVREINDALADKEFLQKIISDVLRKWDPSDDQFQFELLLNKDDEARLKEFFEQRIKKELSAGIDITIDNKIKSGFKIGVKNEDYYVDFSGGEFEEFFKGYLRKSTLEWIYGTKENEHV